MKSMAKWLAAVAVAYGFAGVPMGAWATLKDDGRSLEASPEATVVTADKLTFDYIKKFALFENNVLVNDPRLQLSANRLTIIFTEDGGAQTIKAEGNVLLTQGEKKARSDVMTYDVASGKIVLAGGPPQVMQGRNILEGEVIIFWRDEQKLECKPRARLVVYPDDFDDAEDYFNR